jgi:hypothetical protein
MLDDPFGSARSFMYSHARLLERLLFAVKFEGAAPAAVGRLVSAYQHLTADLAMPWNRMCAARKVSPCLPRPV